jgi:hypothetical protein
VAYVLSLPFYRRRLLGEQLATFRRVLGEEIAAKGAFRMTGSTGIVAAVRADKTL